MQTGIMCVCVTGGLSLLDFTARVECVTLAVSLLFVCLLTPTLVCRTFLDLHSKTMQHVIIFNDNYFHYTFNIYIIHCSKK